MRRYLIVYAILIVLLGIGARYDLSLNQYFYHPQSSFGWFMEHIYILFMIGILPVTFIMLMSVRTHIGTVVLGFVSCLYMAHEITSYLLASHHSYQLLGLSVILFVGLTLLMQLIPKATRKAMLPFLLFVCLVLISASLLVELLKNLWGRVRFRSFHGPQRFTPWYLPQGVNGNKSFPSGHTTAASITLCLFALPLFTKKRLSSWQTMLAVLSPIMMALSRMIMGAHYLSDTVFAILIVYTMLEGAILYMKKSKETG